MQVKTSRHSSILCNKRLILRIKPSIIAPISGNSGFKPTKRVVSGKQNILSQRFDTVTQSVTHLSHSKQATVTQCVTQLSHSRQATGMIRRKLLLSGGVAAGLLQVPTLAPFAHASEQEPLAAFWDVLVAVTKTAMGSDFDAQLQFYSADKARDSPPGNPAQDFGSEGVKGMYKGNGKCGPLQTDSDLPYAICASAPGQTPRDILERECCRHTAYTFVPEKFYQFKLITPVPVVVCAPRIRQFDESSWKAILMHEMGHCIDFYMFGKRYGLLNRGIQDKAMADMLQAASTSERDPELRADNFSNIVLATLQKEVGGGIVCYDPLTTIQRIVPVKDLPCEGTGEIGDPRPLLHFSHPPLTGKDVLKRYGE